MLRALALRLIAGKITKQKSRQGDNLLQAPLGVKANDVEIKNHVARCVALSWIGSAALASEADYSTRPWPSFGLDVERLNSSADEKSRENKNSLGDEASARIKIHATRMPDALSGDRELFYRGKKFCGRFRAADQGAYASEREKSLSRRGRRDGGSPAAFVTLCGYRAAFISDRINSFAAETGYAI